MEKKTLRAAVLVIAFVAIAALSGVVVSLGLLKASVDVRAEEQVTVIEAAQPEVSKTLRANTLTFSCTVPGCTQTEIHQHGLCGIDGCLQIGNHSHGGTSSGYHSSSSSSGHHSSGHGGGHH